MNKHINDSLCKLFIALIALFFCVTNVEAACTNQQKAELNEISRRVRTSFEVVERTTTVDWLDGGTGQAIPTEVTNYEFEISIFNITDDIYVTQTNNLTKRTITIFEHMTENGIYTYTTDNILDIIVYSYRVFSNMDGCSGESLRTYTIRKPAFNRFSQLGMCQGREEIPYCKTWTDSPINVTEPQVETAIAEYLADRRIPNEEEEIRSWLKDNLTIVIIGSVLIVGAIGGGIYIVKKRRTF